MDLAGSINYPLHLRFSCTSTPLYAHPSSGKTKGVEKMSVRQKVSGRSIYSSVQLSVFAALFVLAMVLPFAPNARAATINVSIVDFAFQAKNINVQIGDTVVWTNNGGVDHTVTSDGGGGPLDSPTLAPSGTYSFTFVTDGTYNYHCAFHPAAMKGSVTVGSLIPEYSNAAFVAFGLMVVLLGIAAIGRRR